RTCITHFHSNPTRRSSDLIAHNPHEHPKTLWSEAADGERIRVWECKDAAHEADKVAAEIQFVAQKHSAPWSEFCILFRGNHQSQDRKSTRLNSSHVKISYA